MTKQIIIYTNMAEDIRELPSPLNPREVQVLSYMMWGYEDYFKSLKLSYMDLWHSGVWVNFNKPMKKSVMRGICALSDSLYALIGQDKFQWTKAEDINIKYLDRIEWNASLLANYDICLMYRPLDERRNR